MCRCTAYTGRGGRITTTTPHTHGYPLRCACGQQQATHAATSHHHVVTTHWHHRRLWRHVGRLCVAVVDVAKRERRGAVR